MWLIHRPTSEVSYSFLLLNYDTHLHTIFNCKSSSSTIYQINLSVCRSWNLSFKGHPLDAVDTPKSAEADPCWKRNNIMLNFCLDSLSQSPVFMLFIRWVVCQLNLKKILVSKGSLKKNWHLSSRLGGGGQRGLIWQMPNFFSFKSKNILDPPGPLEFFIVLISWYNPGGHYPPPLTLLTLKGVVSIK